MQNLKLAELMSALSHALDMTEGQPEGHCVRCAWIGMSVGRSIGLDPQQQWELYYTLLLKDLGCSSNAARICALYRTDDLQFKRDFKLVDGSLPHVLRFVLEHTGLRSGLAERFRATLNIFRHGSEIAQELIQTRCQRGADIARQLRFPETVAQGIHGLDEHWDGGGKPEGLRGEEIPLYARMALLAQVIDVFFTAGGPTAARDEVRRRRGSWLDPELADAFLALSEDDTLWLALRDPELGSRVLTLEPAQCSLPLDEDYLDRIAVAFGQIVDAKSPYTAGHSARVALYADHIANHLGIPPERRRWLYRGALLHDVGKLGVSNAILDKAGKLDPDEWAAVQMHATYTERILGRISAFSELARVAGAHHERLDGTGYPRRLAAEDIALETRIITTADIFDAISADRPYRGAVPVPQTLQIMSETVGTALDPRCFDALCKAVKEIETTKVEDTAQEMNAAH